MTSPFISTLTQPGLLNVLNTARQQLIYAAPGISTDIAKVLVTLRNQGIKVKVIIDPAEESFRNSYGELKAIQIIQQGNCEVLEVPGNRVSFVLVDNAGYLLFNQSLALEEQGPGTNAVQLNSVQQQQLLLHFFPPRNVFEATQRIRDLQQAVQNAPIDINQLTTEVDTRIGESVACPLNSVIFKEVEKNLTDNPPVHPDRRRQIMIYTSKFQFVELEFKGANLTYKRVDIPKDVLPVRDKRLKDALETKLKILETQDNLPKSWLTLKDNVEKTREEFLVKIITANKNVLNLSRKKAFTEAIVALEQTVASAKQELASFLMAEIKQTKNRFVQTLLNFFTDNPPDELRLFVDDVNYLTYLKDYAEDIIRKINFPKPAAEMEKITFSVRYYDVTWEDLNSEQFLKELNTKGLITDQDFTQLRETEQVFKSRK
ncbi:hypothetical protein WBJ53_32890 (plasmid) [Spirosoma sp. SC4-14]|uniref:hypothetical protein n=1 Tax=Spirosoma sp. SC4-14 TaxID=3128900 RepID=UPI0030D0B94D